jgi:hypothetical protein
MSLDVDLEDDKGNMLYSSNITHNLGPMAREAGIYACLWRPDENGITKASQIIEPLQNGLMLLVLDPQRFKQLDSPNGWGKWEHFLPFCAEYLRACKEHPDANVRVSR